MNHYETLGVKPRATQAEIKAAFRRKARDNHPDREGGNPEAMAAINRANEVLGDPERRARYDATGDSTEPVPIEVKGRELLMQMFSAALDT
jgi:curved DNA-binding protein CbpA